MSLGMMSNALQKSTKHAFNLPCWLLVLVALHDSIRGLNEGPHDEDVI